MDPGVFTAIASGVALLSVGAIIKVILIFLKHIEKSDTRQENFLGNHLSDNTKMLEQSVRAQEKVADRLERVEVAVKTQSVKVVRADEVQVGPSGS